MGHLKIFRKYFRVSQVEKGRKPLFYASNGFSWFTINWYSG